MRFQIGKAGLTEGTIDSLKLAFKNHTVVRISVLQSLAPNKGMVKSIAEELIVKLGGNYRAVVIGFTIVLKKRGPQPK